MEKDAPPAPDRDCLEAEQCIADLFEEEGNQGAATRYTRRQLLRWVRSVEDRLAWSVKSTQGCHAIGLSDEEVQWIRKQHKHQLECQAARAQLLRQLAGWGLVSLVAFLMLVVAYGLVPAIKASLP